MGIPPAAFRSFHQPIQEESAMIRIAKPTAAGHHTDVASIGTWRKFAIAASALLTLGTFSAPASAKPFQQYLNGACGATLCTINFAKVPAGQRLSITSVSCYARLGFAPIPRYETGG
jgi:hypothetical protein